MFYRDYDAAMAEAITRADASRAAGMDPRSCEVGIEACKEYGRAGYRVHRLPWPEHRTGFELRCQVVTPGTPRTARQVVA